VSSAVKGRREVREWNGNVERERFFFGVWVVFVLDGAFLSLSSLLSFLFLCFFWIGIGSL
jgi:hypothetical protein